MYITPLPHRENGKGDVGKQKLWNECEVQNDLIQRDQIFETLYIE